MRPYQYTPEVWTELCARISEGRSMRSVCGDADMPINRVAFEWLRDVPEAREQYARACEERAEYLAELALTEANNENIEAGAVARDRLKVDTIKWFASKLYPRKYGDRIQQDHTNNGEAFKGVPIIIQSSGEEPIKT